MPTKPLRKYRLGLMVLGALTIVLLLVVVLQTGNVRADKQTYDKATKIATQLENYIYKDYKIPASLPAAGVSDIPDSIRYERLSATRYKFCATYKSASDNFDSVGAAESLAFGGMAGDSSYNSSQDDSAAADSPSLYISSDHKKGENCQIIKPYLYNSSSDFCSDRSGNDALYGKCETITPDSFY